MEWMKKHSDAVMVISAIIASMLWMNGKFNELEKEMTIIKTVLVMKNILPQELARTQENN